MAAGLGFKTFANGDVLTANDTNGYLMQGVWVFADAAARTAAVTSPQEGNMSFLKDTNSTEYYDGAAWTAVGGGGGGGGGLVELSTVTYSNVASQAFDSVFDSTYDTYFVILENSYASSAGALRLQFRTGSSTISSAGYYGAAFGYNFAGTQATNATNGGTSLTILGTNGGSTRQSSLQFYVNNVGYVIPASAEHPQINGTGFASDNSYTTVLGGALLSSTVDHNGFILSQASGNIYGTVTIYGVTK
jgi:hypothetical protein